MLAGMASGLHSEVCVQDLGLSGVTEADGLAVSRPSGFVGGMMDPLLDGEVTIRDARLYELLHLVMQTEEIFLEPSACAGFQGVALLHGSPAGREWLRAQGLEGRLAHAAHIVWATGGALVPEDVRKQYLSVKKR